MVILFSISFQASARALQRSRTVASRWLRDGGMAGWRLEPHLGIDGAGWQVMTLWSRSFDKRMFGSQFFFGWAAYSYPRDGNAHWHNYTYTVYIAVYIFTLWVLSTHLYIHQTCESYLWLFRFAHISHCQTSSVCAAVSLPHQEEESFRKATEFVLLHSPQQGNLKEEAPRRCGS